VIRSLDRQGLPITRQNYILAMHGNFPPDAEWGAEQEAALPPELWPANLPS
jgi:hypothetical protein